MSRTSASSDSSRRPIRLIHASDLHLDRPPYGIVEVPDHLRERLIQCPYESAESVFEAALAESVDALILSGDVVDLGLAGPRAVVFLREQFLRLAEKNIPVFWTGGACDPPGAWPPSAPLPENVHTFPIGRVESHTLTHDGKPIARVVGMSLGRGDYVPLDRLRRDADALLTIGIACGDVDRAAAERSQVDYLALGGQHDRRTYTFGRQTVHYPGTPQGRSPSETGRRGCTLVEIDHEGHITLNALATEVLRWYTERVDIDEAATLETIETTLIERMKALVAKCGGDDLMVTWRLAGLPRVLGDLRRGEAEQLTTRLRERFGHTRPAAWTVELVVEPTAAIPVSWYEQQTILGDVLRRIREMQQQPDMPVDLANYLATTDREGQLAAVADVSAPGLRGEALGDAAALASDLLTAPVSGGK